MSVVEGTSWPPPVTVTLQGRVGAAWGCTVAAETSLVMVSAAAAINAIDAPSAKIGVQCDLALRTRRRPFGLFIESPFGCGWGSSEHRCAATSTLRGVRGESLVDPASKQFADWAQSLRYERARALHIKLSDSSCSGARLVGPRHDAAAYRDPDVAVARR